MCLRFGSPHNARGSMVHTGRRAPYASDTETTAKRRATEKNLLSAVILGLITFLQCNKLQRVKIAMAWNGKILCMVEGDPCMRHTIRVRQGIYGCGLFCSGQGVAGMQCHWFESQRIVEYSVYRMQSWNCLLLCSIGISTKPANIQLIGR